MMSCGPTLCGIQKQKESSRGNKNSECRKKQSTALQNRNYRSLSKSFWVSGSIGYNFCVRCGSADWNYSNRQSNETLLKALSVNHSRFILHTRLRSRQATKTEINWTLIHALFAKCIKPNLRRSKLQSNYLSRTWF